MTPRTVDEIFRRLSIANPNPRTELDAVNGYTFLVAVVLSAQTTDKGVNKATAPLFKVVRTPQEMMDLGETGLKEYIKTIGLYNGKAKSIMALSKILVDKFMGDIPKTREELQALPGVGRKTANVVLNAVFKQPVIAVDRHVLRTSNRIGLTKSETPEETEEQLVSIVPKKWLLHAHHWIVLHGRYVCTARAPKCATCVIKDLCLYKNKSA